VVASVDRCIHTINNNNQEGVLLQLTTTILRTPHDWVLQCCIPNILLCGFGGSDRYRYPAEYGTAAAPMGIELPGTCSPFLSRGRPAVPAPARLYR
jgi:hypothetical protein